MLDALDPDSDHGRVYRALTIRGRRRSDQLVRHTGLPLAAVATALAALAEADAVLLVDEKEDLWEARPPHQVMFTVLRLEEARRAGLWQAGEELDRLYYLAQRDATYSRDVEPIDHPLDLIALTRQLQEQAAEQIRWLDRPPYYSRPRHFEAQEELQSRRLADGLRYRTVYHQAVYDDPDLFAGMTRMIDQGESARVLADLPVKLTIGDDYRALLVPEPDRAGVDGAMLVHASGLLNALAGVFETLWTLGVPMSATADREELSEQDRIVITLMAAGVTDEAIARRLQLSRRTVVRRITALLDRLGATTRFQAGVQAANRGWL
ncbi:regulatory protein, luxR family [Amycolatopsis marina]|uniref:Regulatory protein, luxR family n=1 Tax=Amycolatopsis marina TaxID=490629 RepID=A0A1I1B0Q9_9PSEU|nr:LuxR C-terminal-related transcriptional regulator [Amycolatopsis marina]SFB43935.1 regulatory protein, luxR family [Amycolatopsis marina]